MSPPNPGSSGAGRRSTLARSTSFDTCSLCPRLCRSACPVATGTGRELAAPAWIGTVLRDWERGVASDDDARYVATLCVDCGGCRDLCHLHVPLPELLRTVRARLVAPPPPAPLAPIVGSGDVVVEADERPLAAILARRSGRTVARWPTPDRLGVHAIEAPDWSSHAAAIRAAVGARTVVTQDGGVARALDAAGVGYQWASSWLGETDAADVGSCATGGVRPLACCGGAGPLAAHHPDDAARVGDRFVERLDPGSDRGSTEGAPVLADARCRDHLRRHALRDRIDRWAEEGS